MTGHVPNGIEAKRQYPDRFYLSMSVDPNDGVETLRKMERAKAEHDIVSAMVFPCGLLPAGRDQRQEDVPDLHEVRRARHPDLHQRRHRRPAHAELAADTSSTSTRSATTSPS